MTAIYLEELSVALAEYAGTASRARGTGMPARLSGVKPDAAQTSSASATTMTCEPASFFASANHGAGVLLVNLAAFPDNRDTEAEVLRSGAMVQRLARGPFKAEIRVRFPLALPSHF